MNPAPTPKAVYTVTELRRLTGLTRFQLLKLLAANSVPLVRQGRVFIVYLSALRKGMPDLWGAVSAKGER